MKQIERTLYMNRLKGLQNTPDIKIITGIRRCGKSELMKAYIKYLKDNDKNANIIYIDYTNLDFDDLKEYKALNNYVKSHYNENKNNYLFVDEIQLCDKFELTINSLYSTNNYDIYITGSNAFLLSSDLATLFTGRYIEIPVYPFSFKEYCEYFSDETDNRRLFERYTVCGGLAGSYAYKTEEDRTGYIKDVYKTIVERDLVDKYHISEIEVLKCLSEFLMDNISNLSSPNNISNVLISNSINTNHVTIGKFIDCLCNAFVFYNVKRYDIKGKKYLQTSEKYYLSDLGFRYALLGNRNMDFGRAYENMVCLELLRKNYEVYVGKLYDKEIDFVIQKGNEKLYIQVSNNISDEKTFQREVTPLLQIKDAYPKILIANTGNPEYQYEGIRVIDIKDFLLSQ